MTQGRKPDVMLLSHGRTLSNLFCKMMSKQDGYDFGEYHFHDASMHLRFNLTDKPLGAYPDEDREKYYQMLRESYDTLFKQLEAAHSKGRPVFFKNHVVQTIEPSVQNEQFFGGPRAPALKLTGDDEAHTNPTLLPDSFMLSLVPIFIIRHPVLQNESWYRAISRCAPVELDHPWTKAMGSIHFCRQLFEWYEANVPDNVEVDSPKRPGPFAPIILDADDILDNRPVIEELCRRCNFDTDKVLYEWDVTKPKEGLNDMHRSFLKDIHESTGVDRSKSSKGISIEAKYDEWKEKWGTDVADALKRYAEDAMDDYEYMRARRLKAAE